MMFDLIQAPRDYWRQLDAVEAAYQRNELSLDEVDAKVQSLMQELGQARRQALRDVWATLQVFVQQQRDTLAGVTALGLMVYVWLVANGQA